MSGWWLKRQVLVIPVLQLLDRGHHSPGTRDMACCQSVVSVSETK